MQHAARVQFSTLAGNPVTGRIPQANPPRRHSVSDVDYKRLKADAATTSRADAAVARPPIAPVPIPRVAIDLPTFEGVDENCCSPSDAAVASNSTQVLYAANDELAIKSLSTGLVTGPLTFTNFFSPLSLPAGTQFFDPRATWDPYGSRFVVVVDAIDFSTWQSWIILAASETSDPTGFWWLNALDSTQDGSQHTTNWADQPTLGLDPYAVYVGMNQFSFSTNTFQYAKLRIIDRSALESGTVHSWWDAWKFANPSDGTMAFSLQPAIIYSYSGVEYVVNSKSLFGNDLTVWSITNPLGTPTINVASVTVPPYSLPPNAKQAGTSVTLDTGDTRLQQVVQRDGYLWTTLTTAANFGGGVQAIGELYQIDPVRHIVATDAYVGWVGTDFYYPTVAVDAHDNAIVVASCSSSSSYIDICAATHSNVDPSGQTEPAQYIYFGMGPYVLLDGSGNNRWGDYTAATLDPNGTTVWTLAEYPLGGGNVWGTRVNGLSYQAPIPTPTSTSTPTATPTITPTPKATPTPTPWPYQIVLPFVTTR